MADIMNTSFQDFVSNRETVETPNVQPPIQQEAPRVAPSVAPTPSAQQKPVSEMTTAEKLSLLGKGGATEKARQKFEESKGKSFEERERQRIGSEDSAALATKQAMLGDQGITPLPEQFIKDLSTAREGGRLDRVARESREKPSLPTAREGEILRMKFAGKSNEELIAEGVTEREIADLKQKSFSRGESLTGSDVVDIGQSIVKEGVQTFVEAPQQFGQFLSGASAGIMEKLGFDQANAGHQELLNLTEPALQKTQEIVQQLENSIDNKDMKIVGTLIELLGAGGVSAGKKGVLQAGEKIKEAGEAAVRVGKEAFEAATPVVKEAIETAKPIVRKGLETAKVKAGEVVEAVGEKAGDIGQGFKARRAQKEKDIIMDDIAIATEKDIDKILKEGRAVEGEGLKQGAISRFVKGTKEKKVAASRETIEEADVIHKNIPNAHKMTNEKKFTEIDNAIDRVDKKLSPIARKTSFNVKKDIPAMKKRIHEHYNNLLKSDRYFGDPALEKLIENKRKTALSKVNKLGEEGKVMSDVRQGRINIDKNWKKDKKSFEKDPSPTARKELLYEDGKGMRGIYNNTFHAGMDGEQSKEVFKEISILKRAQAKITTRVKRGQFEKQDVKVKGAAEKVKQTLKGAALVGTGAAVF